MANEALGVKELSEGRLTASHELRSVMFEATGSSELPPRVSAAARSPVPPREGPREPRRRPHRLPFHNGTSTAQFSPLCDQYVFASKRQVAFAFSQSSTGSG